MKGPTLLLHVICVILDFDKIYGRKWICVGKIRGINQGRLKSKPLKYCRFSLPFSNKQIVEAIKFNASKWRIAVKTDDDDYLTSSGFYASGSAW